MRIDFYVALFRLKIIERALMAEIAHVLSNRSQSVRIDLLGLREGSAETLRPVPLRRLGTGYG
jgi:hypothetical protein